jgi:hypothetical protein
MVRQRARQSQMSDQGNPGEAEREQRPEELRGRWDALIASIGASAPLEEKWWTEIATEYGSDSRQ